MLLAHYVPEEGVQDLISILSIGAPVSQGLNTQIGRHCTAAHAQHAEEIHQREFFFSAK